MGRLIWRLWVACRRRRAALVLGLVMSLPASELLLAGFDLARIPAEPNIMALPMDGLPHRLSPSPGLIWEMAPKIRVEQFQGVPVRTNALGLRGPAIFRDKPSGTHRIISLGDSIAFGAGVREEDAYCARLARILSKGLGRRVETINAGVSGYNTVQQLRLFQNRLKNLEADLLVLSHFDDDFDVPYLPRKRGFGIRLLMASRLARLAYGVVMKGRPALFFDPGDAFGAGQEAFTSLLRLGREGSPKLVVVYHPSLRTGDEPQYSWEIARKICKEYRVPWLDMNTVYAASGKPKEDFSVDGRGDPHPNPEGHALIAGALAELITRRGLLPPPEDGTKTSF